VANARDVPGDIPRSRPRTCDQPSRNAGTTLEGPVGDELGASFDQVTVSHPEASCFQPRSLAHTQVPDRARRPAFHRDSRGSSLVWTARIETSDRPLRVTCSDEQSTHVHRPRHHLEWTRSASSRQWTGEPAAVRDLHANHRTRGGLGTYLHVSTDSTNSLISQPNRQADVSRSPAFAHKPRAPVRPWW
jgi:hypothetical protein